MLGKIGRVDYVNGVPAAFNLSFEVIGVTYTSEQVYMRKQGNEYVPARVAVLLIRTWRFRFLLKGQGRIPLKCRTLHVHWEGRTLWENYQYY